MCGNERPWDETVKSFLQNRSSDVRARLGPGFRQLRLSKCWGRAEALVYRISQKEVDQMGSNTWGASIMAMALVSLCSSFLGKCTHSLARWTGGVAAWNFKRGEQSAEARRWGWMVELLVHCLNKPWYIVELSRICQILNTAAPRVRGKSQCDCVIFFLYNSPQSESRVCFRHPVYLPISP